MFVEDEAKVASRVDGVKWGVVYPVKLLFEQWFSSYSFFR